MLFNAREFELFFGSQTLRKGLRLFERGKVILMGRLPNNVYNFLIEGTFDLHLRKRGDKILSYSCSCGQPEFCGHFCAVLFYFQKEALGLTIRENAEKRQKPKINPVHHDLQYLLQPAESAELNDLLSHYPDKAKISEESFNAYFSAYSTKVVFQFCLIQLDDILAQYLQFDGLSQNQINEIHKKVEKLEEKLSAGSADNTRIFCLQLAIVSRLPLIFNLRILGDESKILDTLQQRLKSLDLFSENALSKGQQHAWLEAILISGTLKTQIGIEVFTFLIPRGLRFIRQKKFLEKLKNLIGKRGKKSLAYDRFDRILISRLQLAIKEAELFNTPFSFKHYHATPEFAIAEAELDFCSNKTEKAFLKLENFYETVKTEIANSLAAFQDYIILKAREKNRATVELKYLKESMVTSAYINPANIDRFIELVPVKNRALEIDKLIQNIKTFSKDHSFDKISVLLLKDNRLDDWLTEIKKQKNKFGQLHKIALQKLPDFDDRFLTIYTNHLIDALTNVANDRYHEQVFLKAKKYLDLLPEQKAAEQVNAIINRLGAFSRLSLFIKGKYPGLESQKKKRVNKLRGTG